MVDDGAINEVYFNAVADDGSRWKIPMKVVVEDMLEYEHKGDPWSRITIDMAHSWLCDNSGSFTQWELVEVMSPTPIGMRVEPHQ